jgi:hypothetical protein
LLRARHIPSNSLLYVVYGLSAIVIFFDMYLKGSSAPFPTFCIKTAPTAQPLASTSSINHLSLSGEYNCVSHSIKFFISSNDFAPLVVILKPGELFFLNSVNGDAISEKFSRNLLQKFLIPRNSVHPQDSVGKETLAIFLLQKAAF